MDFLADQLADGRRFRALTMLDLFARECQAIARVRPKVQLSYGTRKTLPILLG